MHPLSPWLQETSSFSGVGILLWPVRCFWTELPPGLKDLTCLNLWTAPALCHWTATTLWPSEGGDATQRWASTTLQQRHGTRLGHSCQRDEGVTVVQDLVQSLLSPVDSPTRPFNTPTLPWPSTLPQASVFYNSVQCILRISLSSKRNTLYWLKGLIQYINSWGPTAWNDKSLALLCQFQYLQRQWCNFLESGGGVSQIWPKTQF